MKAEVYTKPNCPYCVSAKMLLENRGIEYTEISAPEHLDSLMARIVAAGKPKPKTVPQIFLDNEYVGGFDQLNAKLND